MGIWDTYDVNRMTFEVHASILIVQNDDAMLSERVSNFLRAIDVIVISEHSETTAGPVQARKSRSHDLRRHPPSAERLHVDEVSAEKDEIRTKRPSLIYNALKARDIVGMRAGMKVRQEDHPQRTRPARPAIDFEP
jgi:hypothetical protein